MYVNQPLAFLADHYEHLLLEHPNHLTDTAIANRKLFSLEYCESAEPNALAPDEG